MTQRTQGVTIRFDATLATIGTSAVLRLPETASKNLPSRGQVAVHGTINGVGFQTVLEPDGNFGHWMRVDDTLQHAAGIRAGDTAALDIEVTKEGNTLVATAAWSKTLHLVGNMSLLLEFEATATK